MAPPSPPAPVMHSPPRKVIDYYFIFQYIHIVVVVLFVVKPIIVIVVVIQFRNILEHLQYINRNLILADNGEGPGGLEDPALHLQLEESQGSVTPLVSWITFRHVRIARINS